MTLLSIPTPLLSIYDKFDTGTLVALGGFIFLICIVGIIVGIFYMLTLQNTLKAVSLPNRVLRPGQVWLLIIPFFSLIWNFFVVKGISESIEKEYRSRNVPVEHKPTYNIGLAMSILECCYLILPFMKPLTMIAGLVCFIIYWVKVNEYKNKLLALPPASDSQIFF